MESVIRSEVLLEILRDQFIHRKPTQDSSQRREPRILHNTNPPAPIRRSGQCVSVFESVPLTDQMEGHIPEKIMEGTRIHDTCGKERFQIGQVDLRQSNGVEKPPVVCGIRLERFFGSVLSLSGVRPINARLE